MSERVGIIVIAVASRFVASGRAISMLRLVMAAAAVMSAGRLGRRVVLDEETEENDENGLQEEQERDVLHPTRRSWMLAIARRHFVFAPTRRAHAAECGSTLDDGRESTDGGDGLCRRLKLSGLYVQPIGIVDLFFFSIFFCFVFLF